MYAKTMNAYLNKSSYKNNYFLNSVIFIFQILNFRYLNVVENVVMEHSKNAIYKKRRDKVNVKM